MSMDLCIICLRTDRGLKRASDILAEFLDDLCHITLPVTYYCSECEYLLTKFYEFKQKCVEAAKIFQEWMSADTVKEPIDALHERLPSTLGPWTLDLERTTNLILREGSKILYDENFEDGDQTDCSDDIDKETKEFKLETGDHTYSTCNIEFKDEVPQNTETSPESESLGDEINNETKTEVVVEDFEHEEYLDFDLIDKTDDFEAESKESRDGEVSTNKKSSKKVLIDTKTQKKSSKKVLLDKETRKKSSKEVLLHTKTRKKSSKEVLLDKKTEKETERLTANIVKKLSTYGDIVADDRTKIDKDMIIKCIKNKVSATFLKSLWKTMNGKEKHPTATTKKTLKTIHDRYIDDEKYETVFNIEYLKTYEMRVEEFNRRKTYEYYIKSESKCEICYQVFMNFKHLEHHTKMYHNESAGGELCPICKMRSGAHVHKTNKHSQTHLAVFKCKLCPLVTYYRGTMRKHFDLHEGKQYSCETCRVSYKCMSAYYSHMSKHHRSGGIVCVTCGRGFPSLTSLHVHTSRMHRDAPPSEVGTGVRCEECDVTLPRAVFDAHIRDVHLRGPPNLNTWPQSLQARRGNNHKAPRAARDKPRKLMTHQCRVCNEVGVGFGWLTLHFKREHPNEDMNILYADKKTHLCDVCGTGFAKVYALRDHMNIHTGARPYACDLCPSRFRSGGQLSNHRLRHLPAAIPCLHCSNKFNTRAALYAHMKRHTDERSYKCKICDKGFKINESLNEHIRGVHYNIRRVRKRNTHTDGQKNANKVKSTKIAKIEPIETSQVNKTEKIETSEEFETETIETYEIGNTETIDTYEVGETETIDTYEVGETETIETYDVGNTETMETYNVGETETMETYNVGETETIETSEVEETATIETYEIGKNECSEVAVVMLKRKRKLFQAYNPKGKSFISLKGRIIATKSDDFCDFSTDDYSE